MKTVKSRYVLIKNGCFKSIIVRNYKVSNALLLDDNDGKFIKKDQIKELRYKFSMTSLFSDIKVYIIVNAEKMNKESCNS